VHLPSQIPKFKCKACRKSHCVVHNVKWHDGESCAEYDYRIGSLKKKEEEASRLLVEEISKQCPGCKRPVEKVDGCDHMTCKFLPRIFQVGRWVKGVTNDVRRYKVQTPLLLAMSRTLYQADREILYPWAGMLVL
jgi:hypothetical protein